MSVSAAIQSAVSHNVNSCTHQQQLSTNSPILLALSEVYPSAVYLPLTARSFFCLILHFFFLPPAAARFGLAGGAAAAGAGAVPPAGPTGGPPAGPPVIRLLIIFLLTKLMRIINAQLGTFPNIHNKYPSGFRRPNCAMKPSKGWNAPVYSSTWE